MAPLLRRKNKKKRRLSSPVESGRLCSWSADRIFYLHITSTICIIYTYIRTRKEKEIPIIHFRFILEVP